MFPSKYLFLIPGFYILFLLQESLFSKFIIFGFSINLYLVSVSLLVLSGKENLPLMASFLAGLVLDLFSFFPFGVFIFTLTAAALAIKKISELFQKSNALIFFILFGCYFLLYKGLLFFCLTLLK